MPSKKLQKIVPVVIHGLATLILGRIKVMRCIP